MSEKKKMGRPRTDTEAITLRLPVEMIREIDDYRRGHDDLPTRPEAIRRILIAWLELTPKT